MGIVGQFQDRNRVQRSYLWLIPCKWEHLAAPSALVATWVGGGSRTPRNVLGAETRDPSLERGDDTGRG